MEAEILYIFNFSLVLFLSTCKTSEWYGELPAAIKKENSFQLGEYKKKIYSTTPMLSKIYFEEIYESIIFKNDGKFEKKILKNQINYGVKNTQMKSAYGTFTVNGNWILLDYPEQTVKIFQDNGKDMPEFFKGYRLLFYFSSRNQFIIPMQSERELKLENFGVKDFVNIPYDEEEKGFRRGLQIFSEKEMRSHAYYKIDKK